MKIGDLLYIPAEVMLTQFHANILGLNWPIKVCTLQKPSNLLLVDLGDHGEKYIKVLYDGAEWYVEKQDVNKNIF